MDAKTLRKITDEYYTLDRTFERIMIKLEANALNGSSRYMFLYNARYGNKQYSEDIINKIKERLQEKGFQVTVEMHDYDDDDANTCEKIVISW